MNLKLTKQQADELYDTLKLYTENISLSEIRRMLYQLKFEKQDNILDRL